MLPEIVTESRVAGLLAAFGIVVAGFGQAAQIE